MKVRVRRLFNRRIGLAVIVGLVALGSVGCVGALAPPPPGPPIIYGDSNLALAEDSLKPGAVVKWIGNSGPCDFFSKMQADVATHPRVVILAFTGATYSACEHDIPRYNAYLRDLKKARAIFPSSTKVYVILPSPTRFPASLLLAHDSNQDVYKAAWDTGLPRLDAWTPLGGKRAPYTIIDGIHLDEQGQVIYAGVLSKGY
jgi:hypothetical protein